MTDISEARRHDVVLLGATGFTGGLTAEYLARHAPADLRWALAGRNREKLETVRERLTGIDARLADLPLLTADTGDPVSLRTLARSTRVLVTTVGPYLRYGDGPVAACAEAGTDYLDLTGEPEFVDRSFLRHHERAMSTGARLVHCCGFDSIPHDLGVLFTVNRLPTGVPLRVRGYLAVSFAPSAGTVHSAVGMLGRRATAAAGAAERRRVEEHRPAGEGPADRRVRGERPRPRRLRRGGPEAADGWALPMPTVDPQVVLRSARALERYGPDFSYAHHLAVKRLPKAVGLAGAAAGLAALSGPRITREWLLTRTTPGEGPSPEQRARGWFRVRFVGEGGGRRVVTEVAGREPGYDETSKMLAEAAMCLALDEGLPKSSGQVTTAAAMGGALIDRLTAAGIRFAVVEEGPAD
ncbi:trans-acting enoyl reductase family protein [Streptomyces sp. ST2-7A]|uniref:saccharopine dehydrogenase family protein n=1 Tax=Streptomyces sp. ST2-7A TaxID=2907214 RepID=UPI001F463B24|nr:saccharopine dehydrogenase NADP-binding domain-containing protein [Streptomyces sp. ST2-7A]MCE7079834.1 saccharopine dehydrogenase NADP-binding domain-containing protein [Streptomyces sp. ST2-7A]